MGLTQEHTVASSMASYTVLAHNLEVSIENVYFRLGVAITYHER